jgi:hypothetical protein
VTKRLTVQKVTTVIRKTGIGASHTYASRIRGMANVAYGTKVRANGEVVHACARCHGVTAHNEHCQWQRYGTRWNRRVIEDGTFVVTLESEFRGFLSGGTADSRLVRDSEKIEAALTEAGLAWEKVRDFKWRVTGYAEAA